MRHVLVWCLLTEKRLLKKVSYIVVLLIVPVLVWGLRQGAKEEAGMLSIGLYTPAAAGTLSDQVIDRCMTEKSVIRYFRYNTEEEALEALKGKLVDAVWILPEDLESDLGRNVKKKRVKPVVRVVEREDDISLIFSREVLCSRIFPEFVYEAYVDYVKEHMGEEVMTEEELREIYDGIMWKGSLLQPESNGIELEEEDNYVMAPVRGLLSIWMVIAGMAALLYHKTDENNGVYDRISRRKRLTYSFALQAVVLVNASLIYLITCKILNVFVNPGREILSLFLFAAYVAVFCNLLGLLINKVEGIGIMIPILVLAMIALCPIFINLRKFWLLQSLLPPYLYLGGIYASGYLLPLFGLSVGGLVICVLLNMIKNKN